MNKEDYRLAIKFRNETVEENNLISTAFYSIFNEKHNKINGNTSCHAGMYTSTAKDSLGVINCLQKKYRGEHGPGKWEDTTDEEKIMFLNWLANRSPYRGAFVSKSGKSILRKGAAVLTSDIAGNILGGACVSMRRLWEHNIVLMAWCDLVKAGVNENLAYVLGHLISGSKEGGISWYNMVGWHVAINTNTWTINHLKNFVEGSVTCTTGLYKNIHDYNGYSNDLFGPSKGGGLGFIHSDFPYVKKDVSNNPFGKVNGSNKFVADYYPTIAGMVEFQHHIIKVCGINLEKVNA